MKLVVTDYGKPRYRGTLLAKFLQTTGHGHIPIGLGPDVYADSEDLQAEWVEDFHLADYKGTVRQDGARALVDTLINSPEPVTLISIGPTPTVAAALGLEPKIAARTHFVGMFGSVRIGYGGSRTPSAETNVKVAVKEAQRVLAAPWAITITPLDTCGLVALDGARYQRLLASRDPVIRAVIENYRIWSRRVAALHGIADVAEEKSSVLYDTVAVYLAARQDLCTMERLNIRVTDDGFTRIDPTGKAMDVASAWKDLEAYKDFLVNRLAGPGARG